MQCVAYARVWFPFRAWTLKCHGCKEGRSQAYSKSTEKKNMQPKHAQIQGSKNGPGARKGSRKGKSCQTSSSGLTGTVFDIFLVGAFLLWPPQVSMRAQPIRADGLAKRPIAKTSVPACIIQNNRPCRSQLTCSNHTLIQWVHCRVPEAWLRMRLAISAHRTTHAIVVISCARQGLFAEANWRCTPYRELRISANMRKIQLIQAGLTGSLNYELQINPSVTCKSAYSLRCKPF